MANKFNNGFWLIAIVSILIIFANLGSIPLLDPDEPVYAETPKEMFQFNEFISPRIFGEYWYDKPPMYYWLVAASYKIFGINEFAARFPSALLGVICALYVYIAGRRLFNERAAIIGSLVMVTSIEYFYLAKAAVTDITLCLCLTVCLLAFIERRYYLAYIFAGLATLTKGPIGLLFPGAIILLYLLFTRNFTMLKQMKIPSGLLLYTVVAAPWYVMMYNIHGYPFIDTFIGIQNITRFTSPEHPEGVLWYYYIPVLILGFFPWSAIMLQSMWGSLTKSRQEFSKLLFLNIWAIFIFIFFTISKTKLVSYILPMFPPLALIVGWYIDYLISYSRDKKCINWIMTLSLLVILLVGGMIFGLKQMPAIANGVYVSAVVFIVMLLGTGYFLCKHDIKNAFTTKVVGMSIFSIVLVTMMFTVIAPDFTSKNIAQEFKAQYDGQSPVYITKFLHPGFAYYSDVYGIELGSSSQFSAKLSKTVGSLPEAIRQSKRAYFVVRKSEYSELESADLQLVKVLSVSNDKMLLLKE